MELSWGLLTLRFTKITIKKLKPPFNHPAKETAESVAALRRDAMTPPGRPKILKESFFVDRSPSRIHAAANLEVRLFSNKIFQSKDEEK
jgi:hypothetical protein